MGGIMEFQDAESLLDGGTTCLTVLDRAKKKYITIDVVLGRSKKDPIPISTDPK